MSDACDVMPGSMNWARKVCTVCRGALVHMTLKLVTPAAESAQTCHLTCNRFSTVLDDDMCSIAQWGAAPRLLGRVCIRLHVHGLCA
jgi:hypothetical protein